MSVNQSEVPPRYCQSAFGATNENISLDPIWYHLDTVSHPQVPPRYCQQALSTTWILGRSTNRVLEKVTDSNIIKIPRNNLVSIGRIDLGPSSIAVARQIIK